MDYARTVVSRFDASHQVPGLPGCSASHGHTFKVTAIVNGPMEMNASGVLREVRGAENLYVDLERITRELDGRDLDAMMPGASTTPEGIAAWILERMPQVDVVTVEMGWRRTVGQATRTRR